MAISRLASEVGFDCISWNSSSITHAMGGLYNLAIEGATTLLQTLAEHNASVGQGVASLRYCHPIFPICQLQWSAVVGLEQNYLGSYDCNGCRAILGLGFHGILKKIFSQTTNLRWFAQLSCFAVAGSVLSNPHNFPKFFA